VYTENSYNQTLAYRIDGPDVTYLGDEDLHDTRYDSLKNLLISTLMFKAKQDPNPILHGGTVEQESEVHSTYIPLP
jgi:hypothetical protein